MTGAWVMKLTTRILLPQGHSSGSTSYTRESALGKATVEKSLYGLRDDPTQRTEGPIEPVFIFPGEAVEIMVKDSVEGGRSGRPQHHQAVCRLPFPLRQIRVDTEPAVLGVHRDRTLRFPAGFPVGFP